jgi:2,3-dihydroxy-2,3-dihydro-p-cumate dehydrogenase
MSGPLTGKVAIVTGGTTGIGFGITRRLLADGARVFIGALTEPERKNATEALRELGHDVPGHVGDLSVVGEADRLLAEAISAYGGVDILVNNAGGGVIRATLQHTEETLQRTINANLWTTIRMTRALLPHLIKRRAGGRIINIGAESVRNGLLDHAMYNAAKGGVHAMCTALAREFAAFKITVNTVAPSYVQTPEITEGLRNEAFDQEFLDVLDRATEQIPLGRPGTVEDVAGAVAYLAGPDGGFVTGQVISINGGSSMQ